MFFPDDDDDAVEVSSGGLVALNMDDDNTNGIPDKLDTGTVQNEDDLKAIVLKFEPPESRSGKLTLDAVSGGSKIKIWESPTKGSLATNSWTVSSNTFQKTLYVEGIEPSATARDVDLRLRYTDDNDNTQIDDNVTLTILSVDLKVTHPQNPGPTGSAAKYSNTPNTGSADNLFSTWVNEQFRVNVNIQPEELANNLPAGFITWTAAGLTIPDNTTEYTFSWSSTDVKEITLNFPSCNMTKKIRVDVPDVGTLSQTEAAALVALTSPAAAALIAAYADEAIDYSNNNFPVGPQRDAFRHAYWNALCVSHIGVFGWQSILVSTGHEHDNRDEDDQQAFNSTMDLHNNSVGVTINHTTILGTPDRTPIQNDVNQQYADGGLWIWAGGGAQENCEGILVKSNGAKIYSD